MMALKTSVLTPGTCGCHLTWQKEVCRCDQVKDLGKEKLSWSIRMTPMASQVLKRERCFPGSPVVKTSCSQRRRPGFKPWSGNLIPCGATRSPHIAKKILHATADTQCHQINGEKEREGGRQEVREGDMKADLRKI